MKTLYTKKEKSVLVTCYCITEYPKSLYLKATNINYLAVSMGKEFSHSLAKYLWLKISPEFKSAVAIVHIKAWLKKVMVGIFSSIM